MVLTKLESYIKKNETKSLSLNIVKLSSDCLRYVDIQNLIEKKVRTILKFIGIKI